MRMRKLAQAAVDRVREMDLESVLRLLDVHVAVDRDFHPTRDMRTQRWVVSGAFGTAELLVTGPKWFDVRAAKGGGGAIDLAMHLLGLDFVGAVRRLTGSDPESR